MGMLFCAMSIEQRHAVHGADTGLNGKQLGPAKEPQDPRQLRAR